MTAPDSAAKAREIVEACVKELILDYGCNPISDYVFKELREAIAAALEAHGDERWNEAVETCATWLSKWGFPADARMMAHVVKRQLEKPDGR